MKILVLHASAWNLGFLGCYGNDWIATPALDRLAAEGVVFDWHFSANPGLARHSWTGRALESEGAILPAVLEEHGVPFRHVANTDLVSTLDKAGRAIKSFAPQTRAVVWVDLPSLQPPWVVDQEILDHYFAEEEIEEGEEAITPLLDPAPGPLDRNDLVLGERLRSTYAAAVTQLDAGLGLLLNALRKDGQFDEWAVIVCSERGLALGEHGLIGDARPWLHEEVVHVPLIMRLPGAVEAGRRVGESTSTVDILPTFLEWLAIPAPPGHGISLVPLLNGQSSELRDYLCMSWRQGDEEEFAVRTKTWCLLFAGADAVNDPTRQPRLYAKPEDRWEVNDLRQHHLEWAEALEKTLGDWIIAAKQPGTLVPPVLPPER